MVIYLIINKLITKNVKLIPSQNIRSSATARLQRGFSKTSNNIELVGLARDFMLKDICLNSEEEFFAEKTEFTFTLPDLTKYPESFKAFLFKELVESSMLVSLEQEGRIFVDLVTIACDSFSFILGLLRV